MAFGPAWYARAPPVKQPAAALLYTSCFALMVSMTHSDPEYTRPKPPNPLA